MAVEEYARYRDIELALRETYQQTGVRGEVADAIRSVAAGGGATTERPTLPAHSGLNLDQFMGCVEQSLVPLRIFLPREGASDESSFIPEGFDLFAFKHMRYAVQRVHAHGCFDVNYLYRGTARFDYEGVTSELREGDLVVVAPNSAYRLDKEDEGVVIMSVYLRQTVMDTAFFEVLTRFGVVSAFARDVLYEQRSPNYLLFRGERTGDLCEVMQNLFIETNYPDAYSPMAATHWANLLFVALLRNFDFHSSYRGIDETDLYFYGVLEHIQDNLRGVSMGSLARRFGYNESYLSTLFQAKVGKSFRDYVTELRIEKAKQLLATTDMPLTHIAETVGYGSADHLGRRFKQVVGCTPGAYRRKIAR